MLRFILYLFLPLLAAASVNAAPTVIAISAQQGRALGIETAAVDGGSHGREVGLPARVAVPNDQLRVVSAPVAGLIETLDVAPGQSVKKGPPVARLSGPAIGEAQR